MNYPSIRIEGGILSPDIFDRLDDAVGQQPADFGLESSAKVKDEIARAWADAQDYWRIFQRKLDSLKAESPATTETRNNWIVPLLGLLGYQLEYQARGTELNGKNYPISHRVTNRGQTPVHIIGCREPSGLDRKPEKSVLRMSAHATVQEYLNLTDQLFGLVTNGRVLRLMRDSSRLIKLSYLEFDLDRIFADGLFADFAMLYRLLHASRLPQSAEAASSCWLERYHQDTIEQGTRIRDGLRVAVTEALELLGTGFISDPNNDALRQQIESKQLAPEDFFKHILRLVYRLLFLMVTEERGLVFPKGTPTKHINIYFQHYSIQRLRRLALTRGLKIERCHDAWLSLLSTFRLFEQPETAAKLSMTALVGQLFHPESLGLLTGCRLSNAALFNALDRLCNFNHPTSGQRMPVNFGALATEEFGSVYESLLELHPVIETRPTPLFRFKQGAGNERKKTGSYYTPSSLVDCLLDSALDPVLDEHIRDFAKLGFKSAEAAILALNVCDPACGSGHFLIAAAQRIGRRLACVRSGDDEPSPQVMRHALRDVIGHCIYGVDINPMSVELCKVALWMEAMEPGKPLSFLDHHIQCGNSLLGTTPALLAKGIPDDAFTAIEGDVKARVSDFKKQNKRERLEYGKGQGYLFEPPMKLGNIAADFARLSASPDDTVEDVAAIQSRYAELVRGSNYQFGRLLADMWCAVFVWKKDDSDLGKLCPTERDFRKVESNAGTGLLPHVRANIERLSEQYQFFHWHLAFPDVFRLPGMDEISENELAGWSRGFDVVLGNPPWEKINLKGEEFFAETHPEIARAATKAVRNRLVEQLKKDDPLGFARYDHAKDEHDRISGFFRLSGYFPQTGISRINLYSVFCETGLRLLSSGGRLGMVLASGIVTDDNNKELFFSLIENGRLIHAYDFENREGIFPDVDSRFKFCLFCAAGLHSARFTPDFTFYLTAVDQLTEVLRHFSLTVEELRQLNPTTNTCPTFRNKTEAEITKRVYQTVPVWSLHKATDGWPGSPKTPFNMANDSGQFVETRSLLANSERRYLPLYEAKFVHQFNHRFASFRISETDKVDDSRDSDLIDPNFRVESRYWLESEVLATRFPGKWFLAWRDITCATNERTSIAAIIPAYPCAHTLSLVDSLSAINAIGLVACLNSVAYDFCARQKVSGTHLNHGIWKQLPVPPPDRYSQLCTWSGDVQSKGTYQQFLLPRTLELTYTSWDLEPFARDCGYAGAPFLWDEERRFMLRTELDAAFFHVYGLNRDDAAYILDTFPIVRRKDEQKFDGEYKTKTAILEVYDALAEATRTGQPYQTRLDPPPADPRVAHPDTRTAVTVSQEQLVQSGRIAAYVVLLLREWNRPAARNVLEAALVLMLNDRVRKQILNQASKTKSPGTSRRSNEFVQGFDGFLAQLKATGFIAISTTHGTQSIQVGTNVPTTAAPDEDRKRLQETLKALEIVGEDRARDMLQDIVTESYAVVS